jgi:hypothetical protein
MREQDVPKTGFATPFGNFEFKLMPMGLCGAPGTFQMLMDEAFAQPARVQDRAIFFDFVATCLDDICIFSATLEEHLLLIYAVLERLQERKLFVKATKCEWAQQNIEFLGHSIGPQGLSITHDKTQALQIWPAPSSVAEVRSLLGTFGFWRQYIRHYADITEPLTAMTRKGTPVGVE